MTMTWEELEKQVFAHNTEVCARIRQSIGKLPTIKSIDFEDDEGNDEEIFFSRPSSKVLDIQLKREDVPVNPSRNNVTLNDATEKKHIVGEETGTPFKTGEGVGEGAPSGKQHEDTSLKPLKLPGTSERDLSQPDEAFANCLAAGETVFNLIDDL